MTLAGVAITGLLVSRAEPAPLDAGPRAAPVNVRRAVAATPVARTEELDETKEQFAVTTAGRENVEAPLLELVPLPRVISTDR
jgi:hypothetical protein